MEPLSVPESAKPGDSIKVEGYDGPADVQLNPKKKVLFFKICLCFFFLNLIVFIGLGKTASRFKS